jgi:RHS repeat-associated protein
MEISRNTDQYWNIRRWADTGSTPEGETIGRMEASPPESKDDILEMKAGTFTAYDRYYYLKDHLGSIRVTLKDNGSVAGYDDYYPFGLHNLSRRVGMPGRSYNTANTHADQKYTGHFLESEGNLGLYHAQARLYDPAIGRFLGVDAMRVMYPRISSYVYVANNPIIYMDPTGEIIEICNRSDDDQTCVTYEAGMEYEGDDLYIQNIVNRLNEIDSTESGQTVLASLIDTDNKYSIVDQNPKGGVASYNLESKTVSFPELLSSEPYRNYELSHELFHAYQQETGFIGIGDRTVNQEEGAYVFSELIMRELGMILIEAALQMQ